MARELHKVWLFGDTYTIHVTGKDTAGEYAAYISLWILIIIAIIVVVDINVKSNNNNHTYYYEAFAVKKTATTSLPLISLPIQAKDTFSAIETINSLVITIPESGFNITDAFKVILSGEWNLSIHRGNVTNFAVNFLAIPMDGTNG